jgi:dihydroflavonol-4-reductase
MKTILLTGATGFLGKHLVELLLSEEPESKLRLFTRNPGSAPKDARIDTVRGDITRRDQVLAASEGCEQIYHMAGIVERETKKPWRLYDTHVEGTRNVCEAIRERGTGKAVFVSTSGVLAVGLDPLDRDESEPYAQNAVWEWPYYLSKIYAEKLALWYVKHHGLPIVHVNPSLILGPGDERRSSVRDVELFLKGQILTIPVGGLNLVDVRDVAAGMLGAMRKGRPGERYLLGGPNLTFHEWIQRAARIAGVRAPKLMIPFAAQLWGARCLRKLYPLFGKRYELDEASIRMSALYWYCNSEKAQTELGFKARSAEATLRDTIEDLRG